MPFDSAGFGNLHPAETALNQLVRVQALLEDGKRWVRHAWRDGNGGYCLMGAMNVVRQQYGLDVSQAVEFLWDGLAGKRPHLNPPANQAGSRYIIGGDGPLRLDGPALDVSAFNDASVSFAPVRAVLRRAIVAAFAESGLAVMPDAQEADARLRRETERQINERLSRSVFKCIVRSSPRIQPVPKEVSRAV